MKYKLGYIIEVVQPAVSKLVGTELPIRLAHEANKALAPFGEEAKCFYESKDRLVKKYGAIDPATGNLAIMHDSPNIEAARKELQELMNLDVEIPDTKRFPLAAFGDINITIRDLEALNFLIELPTT